MKIVLISPPWVNLPPQGYGGIESVVFNLSEELMKNGHSVTVFATGDSKISAHLQYLYHQSLGIDMLLEKEHNLFFLNHIYHALKNIPSDTDIVHNNCEYYAMHLLDMFSRPFIHTLHGAFYKDLDKDRKSTGGSSEAYIEVLNLFKNHPFVSISNSQRTAIPDLNYITTVYNGVDIDKYVFQKQADDYISWLGRYSPLKGLDIAIEAAKKINKRIVISASVHSQRKKDFDTLVQKNTDGNISYKESFKNDLEKVTFLGKSKLFLFPIQWEEPFGLVMIESMATGTPVVAFARGSVPEVVKDGETGFLVNFSSEDKRGDWVVKKTGLDGLCEAIERMYALPEAEYMRMRENCRAHIEQNFTVQKMARDYIASYEKVLSSKK